MLNIQITGVASNQLSGYRALIALTMLTARRGKPAYNLRYICGSYTCTK